MTVPTKFKVIAATIILALAFFAGQKSVKPTIVTKTVTVVEEKVQKNEQIVTHEVKKPDGTIITDSTTTDKSVIDTNTATTATQSIEKPKLWTVGIAKNVVGATDYSASIERKIFGGLGVMASASTNKTLSVGLSVSF